jgi:hypothetical protein
MAALIKGKHKRAPSPRLVAICDIQPRMLDGYFEREGLNTITLSVADTVCPSVFSHATCWSLCESYKL